MFLRVRNMLGKFHISVTKVAKIMDCRPKATYIISSYSRGYRIEWQKKKTKQDAVYFQAEDSHEQE